MMQNKLCLGTAQLGMCYGIKNELKRQPSQKESYAILEKAIAGGIDTIDTASAYGEAEELLGSFGIGNYKVVVISKVQFSEKERIIKPPKTWIREKVYRSLSCLKISRLEGLLLHTAADFYDQNLMEELLRLKEEKLVKYIGVSIYTEKDAIAVIKSRQMDLIQIPYNVLDQRLEKNTFFKIARKNNVRVFARSAFLQGLLLFHPDNIPIHLKRAEQYVREFERIAYKHGFSKKEAAFLFNYSHPEIDKVVFGVDTLKQLEENLKILEKLDNFDACRKELIQFFRNRNIEEEILLPNLW